MALVLTTVSSCEFWFKYSVDKLWPGVVEYWQIIISFDLLTGNPVSGCRIYVFDRFPKWKIKSKTNWKGWIGQWWHIEKGVSVYHPWVGAVYFKWVDMYQMVSSGTSCKMRTDGLHSRQ